MSRIMLVLGLVVCVPLAARAGEEKTTADNLKYLFSHGSEEESSSAPDEQQKEVLPQPSAKKEVPQKPVTAQVASSQQGCASCQQAPVSCAACCGNKKGGEGLSKLIGWLTYRENACGCHRCEPYHCCTPPLYTFFLHRCSAACSGGCRTVIQTYSTNCCYQK